METPGPPAAVILAAGASTRFGSPKQLARVGERTMLEAVVEVARNAGLDPIVAVVPPDLPVPNRVHAIVNVRPDLGLSRSLQMGFAALPPSVSAAVILLGDQPSVRLMHIGRLVAARGERPVVATVDREGVIAPPILLERDAFHLLDGLDGDQGLGRVLRDRAELVQQVTVREHAADVDTPQDLETLGEACPSCGGISPALPGAPSHPYIGASAGCWAAFNEVIAREFSDPAYGWVHRHTVDVYAAQHPGRDERRERQSVAVHLIGMCHWLEHDIDARRLTLLTQRLVARKPNWPWLEPPASYPMTVQDVLDAADAEAHARMVRAWAESVWDAWSAHHEVVRRWAADAIAGG